jgi:hypothetical protein
MNVVTIPVVKPTFGLMFLTSDKTRDGGFIMAVEFFKSNVAKYLALAKVSIHLRMTGQSQMHSCVILYSDHKLFMKLRKSLRGLLYSSELHPVKYSYLW